MEPNAGAEISTQADKILIERNPHRDRMFALKVFDWAVWSKGVSETVWTIGHPMSCYLIEGEAFVTPDGGEPVHVQRGDLVTFRAAMRCTWRVVKPLRQHYRIETSR